MATETSGGEAAVGLPQLDITTFPNQIFWLVVTLITIYLILSRVALPRIESVLSERSGAITNDIAAAEEFKLKAREAEAAYEAALVEARAEAQKIVTETKASIQADLDVAIAKADAEIAARAAEGEKAINEIKEGAMEAVETVAKDTAAEVVAMLGGAVDAKAIEAAVAARLKG